MMLPLLLLVSFAAPKPELLVSADWLAKRGADANLIVFHVAREKADYDAGHIPGARFLPARSLWVTTGPGVELPSVAQIDSLFESLGVTHQSRIVLYGDAWTTPRAFLALDYIGLGDQAALLDGGMTAWTAAGRSVSKDLPPAPALGSITPKPRPDIIADADWVKARLNDPSVTFLDARTPAEYAGSTEVERLPRYGHIPGAKNLPWTETFTVPNVAADSGRSTVLVDTKRLTALLSQAGAADGKQIVTYCTVGLRASHMYFIARLLGHRPKIYDGSMRDWAAKPDLPLVGPAPKPAGQQERRYSASPDWLHSNFERSIVLHVDRNRASYDSAHVEGARFVPMSAFVVEKNGLPTELPPAAYLDSLLESVGIGDDGKRIVLYGDVLASARLFMTLDYLGLAERTALLDGGLKAWAAGGHPVTREVPSVTVASLTVTPTPERIVDADWVKSRLADPAVAMMDARNANEYAGTSPEEGMPRVGHIPGAHNLDWTTLFQDGKLKPTDQLTQLLNQAGATTGKTVVAYCRVGTRASALYYVARVLGFDVKLYDGSMIDWSRRAELPVATGAAPR